MSKLWSRWLLPLEQPNKRLMPIKGKEKRKKEKKRMLQFSVMLEALWQSVLTSSDNFLHQTEDHFLYMKSLWMRVIALFPGRQSSFWPIPLQLSLFLYSPDWHEQLSKTSWVLYCLSYFLYKLHSNLNINVIQQQNTRTRGKDK